MTTNWFDHYASSATPDDLDVPPAADEETPVEDASPSEPEPEGTTPRRMRWHTHSGGSPLPLWMIKTLVVVAFIPPYNTIPPRMPSQRHHRRRHLPRRSLFPPHHHQQRRLNQLPPHRRRHNDARTSPRPRPQPRKGQSSRSKKPISPATPKTSSR